MKKLTFLVTLLLLGLFCGPASAITIDGKYDDWGINPFVDWNVNLNGAHAQYNNNVVSQVHDGYFPKPAGTPLVNWDIEFGAMLGVQDEGLYFLIVTSWPQTSGFGDLAISIGDDVAINGGSAKYGYGVDLTYLSPVSSSKPISVEQRDVMDVSGWKTTHGGNYPDNPMQITGGNKIGSATVAHTYMGMNEPAEKHKAGGGINYMLEGFVPFELLGVSLLCNMPIEIHYAKVSCLRDYIRLTGTCGPDCDDPQGPTEIPEPTSVLLLGSALVGLGAARRKKAL